MATCVAMDCEMVGGPNNEALAARVSIVHENGRDVLLDKYIKPSKPVSDYRSAISGITPNLLYTADSLQEVSSQVARIINGRILVGHSLDVDLKALNLNHPEHMRRDLALYVPFRKMNGGHPASLKFLARNLLGRTIQDGQHSSVEDAKASMDIYRKVAHEWQ
ncbi:uncharacterized protein [Epargyreus clarus]|uniref:uncharacterized protein n=1 Tax=Epargyreus clarus TaxID=520877 RepID=UPI003C2DE791